MLLALGIVGEYMGKVYLEVKERPRFLIREVLEDEAMDSVNDEGEYDIAPVEFSYFDLEKRKYVTLSTPSSFAIFSSIFAAQFAQQRS